jgi:hypothetical protein
MLHRPMSSSPARTRQEATVLPSDLFTIALPSLPAVHYLNVFIFAHHIHLEEQKLYGYLLPNRGVPVLAGVSDPRAI